MLSFFKRRPGTSLLSALVLFVAGGVVAQVSGAPAKVPPAALIRAKISPPKAALKRLSDWRDQLNLQHARLEGNRLVQVLKGGTRINLTLDPDLQQWAHCAVCCA